MNDPNPVAADPDPTAVPDPAPAPEILPLVELYPACFDRERPRPLRINIHQHLIRAGHDRAAVRWALAIYCTAPRYRAALQAGSPRIDLNGEPAGVVMKKEAAQVRVHERYVPNADPPPSRCCPCELSA